MWGRMGSDFIFFYCYNYFECMENVNSSRIPVSAVYMKLVWHCFVILNLSSQNLVQNFQSRQPINSEAELNET